jgi:hypothetical protein
MLLQIFEANTKLPVIPNRTEGPVRNLLLPEATLEAHRILTGFPWPDSVPIRSEFPQICVTDVTAIRRLNRHTPCHSESG